MKLLKIFSFLRQFGGITLTIFFAAIALFFCWHLLKDFDWQQIWLAVKATPWHSLQLAFMAAVGSYLMLCLYEWSAARYAETQLTFKQLILGGACACAVGNALGMSMLSGGAIRARLYLPQGVSTWQVARMSIFASLSLGTVLPLLAAFAALIHPQLATKTLHLPAVWCLFIIIGFIFVFYLAIFLLLQSKPSTLSHCGWSRAYIWRQRHYSLPSGRLMVWQLPITLIDMFCTASILYWLLPIHPAFSLFLMVYLLALAAGILSHVPGGLGVFEVILLSAFTSTVGLLPLTVALLLYRAIYIILPFVLACCILLIREGIVLLIRFKNFSHR